MGTALQMMKLNSAVPTLSMIAADEIEIDGYEPPREIVEGLLAAGGGSLIYGSSSTGKTFLTLDLACATATGATWMGRRTEAGLVVYVAAESPGSVKARLAAYQRRHGRRLQNLVVVQDAVNMLQKRDTDALIQTIKAAEERVGKKATLIVGDTLARLTSGGDENSGQDMGAVIGNFDRIRGETGAHFLLIHHSGKDREKGARGHSSLRAAVDTEIEVLSTDEDGRWAQVTKQRDLPGLGDRIGFDLEVVEIGASQWGTPVTSCVVSPGSRDGGRGKAAAAAAAKCDAKAKGKAAKAKTVEEIGDDW